MKQNILHSQSAPNKPPPPPQQKYIHVHYYHYVCFPVILPPSVTQVEQMKENIKLKAPSSTPDLKKFKVNRFEVIHEF